MENMSVRKEWLKALIVAVVAFVTIYGMFFSDRQKQDESNGHFISMSVQPQPYIGPVVPLVITDPQAQATWFVNRFWDEFDFRDSVRLRPELLNVAFASYASALFYVDKKICRESICRMFDAAALGGQMSWDRFADLSEEYFGSRESPTRCETAYIYAMDKLLEMSEIDSLQKIRYQALRDLACRNRPGMKAEEIRFENRKGTMYRLSMIDAEFTLLFFYDPECGTCSAMRKYIIDSPIFEAYIKSERLTVVAIYAGYNKEHWHTHLSEMPKKWIVGYELQGLVAGSVTYDTSGLPLLYLLDRDKTVILKEPTVEVLEAWLAQEQNENRDV